jgi:hypothetical protein
MEMQKNSGSETSCETICEVGKRQGLYGCGTDKGYGWSLRGDCSL